MPVVEKHLQKSYSHDPWFGAVLVCFTLFAWANWGKLALPLIDIGHEVEPPARILAGQVFYRDIESYYAPLAYYANALALLVFGQHLEVFYTVGLGLTLAATLLFYRLAKRLMNASWSALCTVCMLVYCAIGPSIFNFIVPYSYGAVYAIVFCLLAFTFLDCYSRQDQLRWLLASAIACGFAGLAKQEYGVAMLGGVLVGINLYSPQELKTKVWRSVLVLVIASASAFLPLALLAQQVSWDLLQKSLLPVAKSQVLIASGMFELSLVKTFQIWWRGFKLFFAAFPVVLGAVIAARWSAKLKWFKNFRWLQNLSELLSGVALSIIGLAALKQLQFFAYYSSADFFQPLSDLSWSLPIFVGWFAFIRPRPPAYKCASLLWALLIFSLLLNARWLFYINFYGLYATSVILLFFTLLYHLSQRMRGIMWRCLLICLLISICIKIGELAAYHYKVHSSYGTLYTKDIALARAFNQTIDTINASRASSVLVLPQGTILNFLTATHSPSRETNIIPGVLPTVGDEQNFVAHMQSKPPELIVYVDVPFYSLKPGYQTFAEVNPLIHQWIIEKHLLIHQFPIPSQFPWNKGEIRIYSDAASDT